jgi:hypothetical protein
MTREERMAKIQIYANRIKKITVSSFPGYLKAFADKRGFVNNIKKISQVKARFYNGWQLSTKKPNLYYKRVPELCFFAGPNSKRPGYYYSSVIDTKTKVSLLVGCYYHSIVEAQKAVDELFERSQKS